MPGELRPIGTRPTLVASFDPPAEVPAEALRVEYGRAPEGGLFVRVRIDEAHLPPDLAGR